MAAPPRHFLDIADFDSAELNRLVARSRDLKMARRGLAQGAKDTGEPLKGRVLAMIFERPSTRTRVSFEVGMRQLGGEALVLSAADMQLGRGESIVDTARVLSRYVDAIMIRAADHAHLLELARHASVPVINGLTNVSHPCQVMADIQTLEERQGPLCNQQVAWVGDCNNVTRSWIQAIARMGGVLTVGAPEPLQPDADLLQWADQNGAHLRVVSSADEAVRNASCVITDAWVSMHDSDTISRHNLLRPFQVDARLMSLARPDAIFMHCLPAHRGEEVTDEVIDGPNSAVLDEAENRLHIQKAILLHCLG
jgi:ornithine carbamoyltransferase